MSEEFGLYLLGDEEDGKGGMRIGLGAEKHVLTAGNLDAAFELKKGKDLTLRIFTDKNPVEVFANDRQAVSHAHKQDIRKNPNHIIDVDRDTIGVYYISLARGGRGQVTM